MTIFWDLYILNCWKILKFFLVSWIVCSNDINQLGEGCLRSWGWNAWKSPFNMFSCRMTEPDVTALCEVKYFYIRECIHGYINKPRQIQDFCFIGRINRQYGNCDRKWVKLENVLPLTLGSYTKRTMCQNIVKLKPILRSYCIRIFYHLTIWQNE